MVLYKGMVIKMKRKDILKRLAFICTAAMLVVCCASCGNNSDTEKKSSLVKPDKAIESKVDKEALEADEMEVQSEEVQTQDEKNNSDSNANEVYEQGEVSENSFVSEYIGIKFELPQGYTMYNHEQMEAIMEQLLEDTGTTEDISYEAIIHNKQGDVQVIVAVDKNKGKYSEAEYLGGISNGYAQIPTAQIGKEISYATIAGMEFSCLDITSGDTSMLHCIKKKNNDMIYFLITYPKGNIDAVQTVMNAFMPL